MNIYAKLNAARTAFHALQLKKTGRNTFANYDYFELGDFLIPAMKVLSDSGLCAVVSFERDTASMRIVDVDKPEDCITITSPMGSAALKGCHEVQNIGAVETYQRRYLWVAAMEIVEHDALDATTGKDKKPGTITATDGAIVRPERMSVIVDVATAVKDHMAADDTIGAYEEASGLTDPEEKTALWKLLDSKTRAALKERTEQLKKEAGFSRA
jgi:hypothetical protein